VLPLLPTAFGFGARAPPGAADRSPHPLGGLRVVGAGPGYVGPAILGRMAHCYRGWSQPRRPTPPSLSRAVRRPNGGKGRRLVVAPAHFREASRRGLLPACPACPCPDARIRSPLLSETKQHRLACKCTRKNAHTQLDLRPRKRFKEPTKRNFLCAFSASLVRPGVGRRPPAHEATGCSCSREGLVEKLLNTAG
jgi:hypothetical protein